MASLNPTPALTRRGTALFLDPDTRRRLEAAAEAIIATLNVADGDPDAEPDSDGEADVTEASLGPVTLAPDRRPTLQRPRCLRRIKGGASSLPMGGIASTALPEIAFPDPNPMGHAPRAFRLCDDTFAPALARGDLIFAVPVSDYRCEGLYLLTFAERHIALYRCEVRPGGTVSLWKDNRALGLAEITLTRAEFAEAVLAQVAVTGRLVSGGLLPEVLGLVA